MYLTKGEGVMYSVKDILRIEVAPALGCTEPAAVALCTAAAKSLIPDASIDHIDLWVDKNVYKNGMGVAIPGAHGACGIDLAAALGVLGGNPELKLEVLEPINESVVNEAKQMVQQKKVAVHVDNQREGIYVKCILKSGQDTAEAVIDNLHDNLTLLKRNDKKIANNPLLSSTIKEQSELAKLEIWLKQQKLDDLIAMVDTIDDEDIEFLKEGLSHNLKLAHYGLTYGVGLGVGRTLERLAIEGLLQKDMVIAARILTSAAADARMSGVKLPAMSSGGSGNHGLTAILPVWAIKDFIKLDNEKVVYKAMTLSHIVTAYIKAYTGRLSAVCGCSVAAGAGATAAIAYLMGGTIGHIADSIKNLIGDLAGVICDGAKNSCALKLATAAGTAVQSALFALHGVTISATDGIIGITAEQTMKNMGKLSTDGMIETDRTILQIMIDKHFSPADPLSHPIS